MKPRILRKRAIGVPKCRPSGTRVWPRRGISAGAFRARQGHAVPPMLRSLIAMEVQKDLNDSSWILRVARDAAEREIVPAQEITETARSQAETTRTLPVHIVRQEIEGMLMGRGVHLALQWMHDAGVLAI